MYAIRSYYGFRFIKSMSISFHGRSRLNWVWNCSNGLFSWLSAGIHIFAGEKVCIHTIIPTQFSSWFASRAIAEISSKVVPVGFSTTFSGKPAFAFNWCVMVCAWSATCFSVSAPYKCWLPTTNHTSNRITSYNVCYTKLLRDCLLMLC